MASLLLSVFTRENAIALLWASLAGTSALALLVWGLARRSSRKNNGMTQEIYKDHDIRNRLARWLTTALVVTGLLLALALVDSLGQSLYAVLTGSSSVGVWLTALFSSLGVFAGFSRWIAIFFSKGPKGDRPPLPLKLVATVAALLLVFLLLVSLNAASHAITWGLARPKGAPERLVNEDKKNEQVYGVEVRGSSAPLGMNVRVRSGQPDSVKPSTEARERDLGLAFLGFTGALLLSFLLGQTWPFVNRSTHQPIYGARLTRAYLGASNEKRWTSQYSLTEPVEDDDLDLARYWPPPEDNGAPLHLINVTINETIDGQSQVQQQDRKGLGMALGPGGISAGVKHHMILDLGDDTKKNPWGEPIREIHPPSDFRVFDYQQENGMPRFRGEMLPLGAWVSISGAAFSTGTGLRTSLGMSLLAGFGNVRLGRWWDSGIVRKREWGSRKISLRVEDVLARLLPVQTYLLDEFLARFPGTARRHWYLSDGGHFENMGGYELVRRRLPFIVIVDGEMDADYTCEGLANLVRKARIDFGAEVRFLTEDQLDEVVHKAVRPYVGTLEQLRRGKWSVQEEQNGAGPHGRLEEAGETGLSLAHAALGRITYDSNPKAVSWLLYVKPTLTGREPVDILEYHKAHSKFPHEPTIDQYFDEPQWESYRRLGQYIAEMLFGEIEQLLPGAGSSQKTLLKDWGWQPDEIAKKTYS